MACECSGIVRDRFIAAGHDAWSCDIKPTERPGPHFQGSVVSHDIIKRGWDMLIAFPDCTYVTVAGAKHMSIPWRAEAMQWAVAFVRTLWALPIKRKAIENPISRLSTLWRKPTQIVQPWWFGHGETKATCLWLDNLDPLEPTEIVSGREPRIWKMPPGPNRAADRSRTLPGFADAMVDKWGRNVFD